MTFIDTWEDPQELGCELPPVLPFNGDLLPTNLRPLVEDVAESLQVPPDFPAASAIVALAGVVNRRALIQPKVEDRAWKVVPNLWGIIIAPPGFLKSPTLRYITRPLVQIEELWRLDREVELETFEISRKRAKLDHAVYEEQYKAAKKKNLPLPIEPDTSLVEPSERRLVLADCTFEKLHEILSDNPAGVMFIRDELTGWLADLEKAGRESERAFFLQSWSGDAGFSVDRIGRGSVYVPAVCVSLIGLIQPARVRWYFAEVLRGGPADDGLFQRFQVMVWPDMPAGYQYVDRQPNVEAERTAEAVYKVLANLSPDFPVQLRFSPGAQQFFVFWLTQLETTKIRSSLHPTLIAHLAKYRKLMPALAGLFQLADEASTGSIATDLTINTKHAMNAAELCAYFESHANRIYSCVVSPELQAAHELCRHIRRGDLEETFTMRTVYRKKWAGLDSAERVEAALDLLEDAFWVRRVEGELSQTGGRPSDIWMLNPKIAQRCQK